jgi:hypothetical protein
MINQVTIQTGVHSPPSISYLSLLNESLSQAEVSFSKKVPFRFENVFRQESAFQQEGAFPFRKMLRPAVRISWLKKSGLFSM